MWALVLMLYTSDINDAEMGLMRGFTSELACEAAGALAQTRVSPDVRLQYLCLPVSSQRT